MLTEIKLHSIWVAAHMYRTAGRSVGFDIVEAQFETLDQTEAEIIYDALVAFVC